jgi:hypothetical protein
MSSSMPIEVESVAHLAPLWPAKGPQTVSKRSWTRKRTSQWRTPVITAVPDAPEPLKAPQTAQTDAMVNQTVQLDQVACPVHTDLSVAWMDW